jgi:hypothetical protein
MMPTAVGDMRVKLMSLVLLAMLVSCRQSKDEEGAAVAYPAGQGPSIEETVVFITNFASASDTSLHRDRAELSPSNPCVITFFNGSDGWEIDFRSLNPDRVTLQEDPPLVWIRTTNGEESITFKKTNPTPAKFQKRSANVAVAGAYFAMIEEFDPREHMKLDSISFHPHLGAEDRLPKVRDALVHLIQRCGGKKDLF